MAVGHKVSTGFLLSFWFCNKCDGCDGDGFC